MNRSPKQLKGAKSPLKLHNLDWKIQFSKIRDQGRLGRESEGFGLYSNSLRKWCDKRESALGRKSEQERGSEHKRKLQRRGKHTSQLGRQGSRKALGEDPLSLLPCSLEFTYPQIPSPTLLITTRSGPWELNIVANPAEGVLCQYTVRLGYVCRD